MPKYETLSYKELTSKGKAPLPLNWRNSSGEISRVVLPEKMVGTKSNIVVLTSDCFPTGSSFDATAYFNIRNLIENKKIKTKNVDVCAVDSAIASYAWAASVLGVGCTIRTPQLAHPYWLKKAKDFGAKIEFEGTKALDVTRIIDSNRKKDNFICEFMSPVSYTFHNRVTGNAAASAVEDLGNGKVVIMAFPASSGGISGAASYVKAKFPYSKTVVVEPDGCSTFYNNKRGVHKVYGSGYGLIPFIHNLMATDYVMVADEEETIKTLKCIESFSSKISTEFNIEAKETKKMVNKFGITTTAQIIAAITLAKQLHLSEKDNVVIIGEDTCLPYTEVLKNELLEDIEVKTIIEEALIKQKFRPVIDVTGQRQRERLFKKKNDFWTRRNLSESELQSMRKKEYWEKLPKF